MIVEYLSLYNKKKYNNINFIYTNKSKNYYDF